MKKMRVIFFDHEEDKRLLAASLKALQDPVLVARYEFTVEHDDTAKQTTLWFWRRNGTSDAQ